MSWFDANPIVWAHDLLTGPERHDYDEKRRSLPRATGRTRRQAAFERGDRPPPAAACPPPRWSGWEDNLL